MKQLKTILLALVLVSASTSVSSRPVKPPGVVIENSFNEAPVVHYVQPAIAEGFTIAVIETLPGALPGKVKIKRCADVTATANIPTPLNCAVVYNRKICNSSRATIRNNC